MAGSSDADGGGPTTRRKSAGGSQRRRTAWLGVAAGEFYTTLLSALLFCVLLASYYLLRPLRDELAVHGGTGQLAWTFTATFAVMLLAVPLFGWLLSRFPLARVLPGIYLFFAASLLAFAASLALPGTSALAGPAFFVWVSVYNLCVVSVFWSLMADLHAPQAAARLFGLIAAGGSIGAVTGPLLAIALIEHQGRGVLLPAAAALLTVAAILLVALRHHGDPQGARKPLGGHPLQGVQAVLRQPYLLGICGWLLLYSGTSTLLYFSQTEIVGQAIADRSARTQLFAAMDLTVNTLSLLGQVLLTGRVLSRFGSGSGLGVLPVVSIIGFALLTLSPTLAVIVGVQVMRRATNFAFARPARETLFTVVGRDERFKAKNLIDTVVYRGGDALSGWLHSALQALGLAVAGIAGLALPLAAAWLALSAALGRGHRRRSRQSENTS
ncbi:MAG: MFS transporter [Rhodocyclaceae bacterium]|nr:MFS transporter [Rhodocyclaceae bacterium]